MKPLKINPEFECLIPPLCEAELHQLTQNIIEQGCRDAIKTWNGTIVDGHNRYSICQAHNIPYETCELKFQSKKDAIIWILENQLGRRNLTNAVRIKIALQKASMLRIKAKHNRSTPGCEPIVVRKTVANDAGVSERTVYKYMKIQELGGHKLLQQVDAGEYTIGKAYNMAAGLDVTTRVVEVLYDSDTTPDVSDPHCAAAVHSTITRIENLYKLIHEKADLLCFEEESDSVIKRLDAQVGVVSGLLVLT